MTIAAQSLPVLIYRWQHGGNPGFGPHLAIDSESYSLRPIELVLPVTGDRIGPFGALRAHYDNQVRLLPAEANEAVGASLGVVGVIGMVWLLIVFAVSGLESFAARRPPPHVRAAATATGLTILVGTYGGISALVAFFVSPWVRGWNRVSVVIAFLSLFGAALLLDAAVTRLGVRTARRRAAAPLLLVGALMLGVADQGSTRFVPPQSTLVAKWNSDDAFLAAIEHRLGKGAMVYELPYHRFPEGGSSNRAVDYALLTPYEHDQDLRWSAGAIKGRPSDWQAQLADAPVVEQLPGVAAAGFTGVYVDRYAYGDNGAGTEHALARAIGAAPLVSVNGRLSFFDLRGFAGGLRSQLSDAAWMAMRASLLYPAVAQFGAGFYGLEQAGGATWHWAQNRAILEIRAPTARTAVISGTLADGVATPAHATLSTSGGGSASVPLSTSGTPFRVTVGLRAGRNQLILTTDAPAPVAPGDPRTHLAVRLIDLSIR